ncbi:MAG: cation:proton antiporter [Flavobacteriales bacterium]|nr:cation:proton antiporter [Flavobacteriales bacterium]
MLLALPTIELKFPLENPVLIFSLVLFIILFGPLVLNRLRIPPIIGLIIAGAVIGPNGLNLMLRDASIVLFGTVGLLYIMFLAGLEIDMQEFKKNKYRSIVFGLFTFLIPMGIGAAVSFYVLGYPMNSSILLASMFASHTLIAYPIASRFGVIKNRAVNITVGGTIITDTLALLVLAVVVGMVQGDVGQAFWTRLGVSLAIFTFIVMWVFPWLARWFFKKEGDSISQYIFVLATVFLAAFLAELAGVEAIIGAFAAGLALNRLIPHTSPLMNRIEFVGNALFIPFFLIGVGMLVDYRIFFKGWETLKVAATMTVVATACKFIAAWLAKLSFRFSRDEFMMMFGLSNAQAAATLAAVTVGYKIILGVDANGNEVRLLSEAVLNGTIVMILVTCTISSFTVARAASRLAVLEEDEQLGPDDEATGRILVSLAGIETAEPLVELAVLMKQPKARERLYALHVVDEQSDGNGKRADGRKLLEQAVKQAAATDNTLEALVRHDINTASGLTFTIKEYQATDVVLGLTREGLDSDPSFGALTDAVLARSPKAVFIYRPLQPLGTVKRIIVAVPPKAEFEAGFVRWFDRVKALVKQTGATIRFHGTPSTLERLRILCERGADPLVAGYEVLDDWEDLLIIGRGLGRDDLLVVVAARKGSISYDPKMDKLPRQLGRYFTENGFLVIMPEQLGDDYLDKKDLNPAMTDMLEEGVKTLDSAGRFVKKVLKGGK